MELGRRAFLMGLGAFSGAGMLPISGGVENVRIPGKAWAVLLHMGTNMWCDKVPARWGNCDTPEKLALVGQADHFRFYEELWREYTGRMVSRGLNMVVIDVGEAVVYPSHPELGVKGSWTPDRLRTEVARLRKMGLEPIPKLNFSTAHDTWLKEYGRMVSTQKYYQVCRDVIRDVCEIFDHPRWFHLGYDEETANHQSQYEFAVVRQGELWWHDFLFFVKTVEDLGMRPWIWSDFYWHHPEDFLRRMPRSVLQSNWYYAAAFEDAKDFAKKRVQAYVDLDKAGFDQMPCGSNWSCDENFGNTVKYCAKNISAKSLSGFLMAPWYFTVPVHREKVLQGIDIAGAAKQLAI